MALDNSPCPLHQHYLFLVLYAFRAARDTLTLFLFAILFAYSLLPLVNRLEKPLRGRGKAILAVYLALIAVLVGIGVLVGPNISHESQDLARSLPSLSNRLASGDLVRSIGQQHGWTAARIEQVQGLLVDHKNDILGFGRNIAAKLAAPVSHIWWLILIPILSLFFLKQGPELAGSMHRSPQTADKKVLDSIFADVNVMLGSYIRSQIVLVVLTLVAYTLVLSLMRVPYAFILGPLAGLLEFIPVVGPAVAAVSVLLIAMLSGYDHALWLVAFFAAWRLVQDYVDAPRIMGKSLEIDPLVQIFAVLAGGEIGGIVGALISVPVVAFSPYRIASHARSAEADDERWRDIHRTDYSLNRRPDTLHIPPIKRSLLSHVYRSWMLSQEERCCRRKVCVDRPATLQLGSNAFIQVARPS